MSNVKFIYKNFPFITDIYDVIKKKLRSVQKQRYITTTPWIKATPGASLVSKGNYQKIILQSIPNSNLGKSYENTSLYTFGELYRSDASYRPVSGITKISVDYKNPYGGVRRAKINWICHSLADLEQMTPYYFNVGKTIFLEWGRGSGINNKISDNGTLKLDNYFEKTQTAIIKSEGQYDALIGYITNFSYNVNADLSYECTTDIVSIGALMEGISNNNQKFDAGSSSQKNDINISVSQTLFNYIKNNLDDDVNSLLGTNTMYVDGSKKDIVIYRDGDGGMDNEHIFISWGFVEDKIFKKAGPNLFVSDKNVLTLDSSGIPIRNHPCLRTTDLTVCFLPVTNGYKNLKDTTFDLAKENWALGFNYDFSGEYYANSGTKDTQENNSSTNNTAFVRNIYVNLNYFKQKITSTDNLFDSILTVFKGINSACGNVWDFKIGSSPDHSRYYVCDAAYMNSIDLNLDDIFLFNSKVIKKDKTVIYPSLIKTLSIETSMSTDISMNAFYGSNKKGNDSTIENNINETSINLFNKKYKDSFIKKIEDKVESVQLIDYNAEANANISQSNASGSDSNTTSYAIKSTLPSDVKQYYGLDNSVQYSDSMKHYLPVYPQYSQDYKKYWFTDGMRRLLTCDPSNTVKTTLSNILLPIKVRITMEGISGIKIGDCFNVDCLPKRYKEKGAFQIIELKHDISRDGWFTEFRGSYRVLGGKGGILPEGKAWSDPAQKESYGGSEYIDDRCGIGSNPNMSEGNRLTGVKGMKEAIKLHKNDVIKGTETALQYQKDRNSKGLKRWGNTVENIQGVLDALKSTDNWTVDTVGYRIIFWGLHESSWKTDSVNEANCRGVFQLNCDYPYDYAPPDAKWNASSIIHLSADAQVAIVARGTKWYRCDRIFTLTGGRGNQASYPKKGWKWLV